jgi:hypothetical protein
MMESTVRTSSLVVVIAFLLGCGGEAPPPKGPKEPKTAAERARLEYAKSPDAKLEGEGKKWGGWRYTGSDDSRDTCFFVVGRRCFSKKMEACAAAACKGGKKCSVSGGGPATVSCK